MCSATHTSTRAGGKCWKRASELKLFGNHSTSDATCFRPQTTNNVLESREFSTSNPPTHARAHMCAYCMYAVHCAVAGLRLDVTDQLASVSVEEVSAEACGAMAMEAKHDEFDLLRCSGVRQVPSKPTGILVAHHQEIPDRKVGLKRVPLLCRSFVVVNTPVTIIGIAHARQRNKESSRVRSREGEGERERGLIPSPPPSWERSVCSEQRCTSPPACVGITTTRAGGGS